MNQKIYININNNDVLMYIV